MNKDNHLGEEEPFYVMALGMSEDGVTEEYLAVYLLNSSFSTQRPLPRPPLSSVAISFNVSLNSIVACGVVQNLLK
jgi:hypothetical protein